MKKDTGCSPSPGTRSVRTPSEKRSTCTPFNFDRPDDLRETLEGTDTLFNTYWIRVNHGGRTHDQCVEQTKVMFQAARDAGVRRLGRVFKPKQGG